MSRRNPERLVLNLRITDLNRLFAHRYGKGDRATYTFPEGDDSANEDLDILIRHYASYHPAAPARIIKLRAPWMNEADARRLIEKAFAYPRRWRSGTLGRIQNYSADEWRVLKLRTLTPTGITKGERQRVSAAARMERMRRRRGSKPRAVYEGKSLSRNPPWIEKGISRAVWYRQQKAKSETGTQRDKSVTHKVSNNRNTPVSPTRVTGKSVKKEAVRATSETQNQSACRNRLETGTAPTVIDTNVSN